MSKMFDSLFKLAGAVSGNADSRSDLTMEKQYLRVIGGLDEAETGANNLVALGYLPPDAALAIAQLKQRAIEEFAATNRRTTLADVIKRCDPENAG